MPPPAKHLSFSKDVCPQGRVVAWHRSDTLIRSDPLPAARDSPLAGCELFVFDGSTICQAAENARMPSEKGGRLESRAGPLVIV